MYAYLIGALILLFTVYKLYTGVLLPYKLYTFYQNQFKQKKYRTYLYKFIPYGVPMILDLKNDQALYKDSQYKAKYVGIDYDIILSNLASRITLVLVNPKLIQQFYLLDGTPTYIKEKQFIKTLKRVAKTSITFTEGQPWKIKRRFMTSFLNFNQLIGQFPTIVNITNRKLAQAAKGRKQFQVYLIQLLQQMTSATIIEFFFGGGDTDAQNWQIQGKKISSYMRQLMQNLGQQALDPLSFLLGQQFTEKNLREKDRRVTHMVQKYKQFTSNFVKNRIYEIKQGKSTKQDYVHKIYHSVKQQERNQQFITNVMYDFSSLYIAGTDTTSHSAMMVIYYLIMYPEVRKKVQKQISDHIKNDDEVTYQKSKGLIYLDCTIHESLRLYQPANGVFIRQATHDHLLGDLQIKKGTLFMISSLTNHYNPQNFENPTQFKPQRWLNQDNTLKVPKPFTWLTFSAGARSCIGKNLALMEIKIFAIQFLRKYVMTMQTTDLVMQMRNFSYQPQKLMTKFIQK